VIKADIGKVADIQRMFETIKSQFGGLDIFVSNARATLATGFYAEPMEIPLEAWQATFDTQATEFLVAVRAAVPMMGKNGRIIGSSPSLMRPAGKPAAGSLGSPWAQRKPRRRRWLVISRSLSPRRASR
jgi:NAD(P)-dependent dehydrogenase (short-subunit alcohol dehydrogenase family)